MHYRSIGLLLNAVSARRRFILLMTLIPALITGITLFFYPRTYIVNFSLDLGYDRQPLIADRVTMLRFDMGIESGMNEQSYIKMRNRFYSQENLELILSKIENAGIPTMKKKIERALAQGKVEKTITLVTRPTYLRFQQWDNLKLSDRMNPDSIQKISELKLTGLDIVVKGYPEDQVITVANIVKNNLRQVMPMFHCIDRLTEKLMQLKNQMSTIDSSRKSREIVLENLLRNLEKLEKIENLEGKKAITSNEPVIHFDNVEKAFSYLPIRYQVQSTRVEITRAEEHLRTEQEMYDYYAYLVPITERIRDNLLANESTARTIDEHIKFISTLEKEYEANSFIAEYISGYHRFAEIIELSLMSVNDSPIINPRPKNTLPISLGVLLMCAVLSIMLAILFETMASVDQGDR